jgi:hypothetical protein
MIDDQGRTLILTLLASAFMDAEPSDRPAMLRLIRQLEGVDTCVFVERHRSLDAQAWRAAFADAQGR